MLLIAGQTILKLTAELDAKSGQSQFFKLWLRDQDVFQSLDYTT